MRIIFFGTPSFAVSSLEALLNSEEVVAVVTQPDRRKGRDRIPSPPPVKELALKRGIRVLQPKSVRDPLFSGELNLLKPDVIVVVAYGKILPKQILQIPTHDCINVHASLLPKYRGAAPVQWAIINGEKETGITIMIMDEGLDTGDILLQEEVAIYEEDNSETLGQRLAELGGKLLILTLQKMKDGTLIRVPQTGTPSYAPPFKKEDGRIHWSKTAVELFNFIRGMYPWPCAYCHLKKERIKIIRVNAVEGSGVPGRIEKAAEELLVGTGKGLISIIELQPEGKRLMTAKEFLLGRRLKEGAFLDGR
jgi:methionyl-tRNA formyltransferase